MFVTMLARLAGVNQADYPDSRFADVEASAWYAPSVSWAASKGIVSGVGDGKFEPNRNITRQEMAVIMAGYLAWKGIDTTPGHRGLRLQHRRPGRHCPVGAQERLLLL